MIVNTAHGKIGIFDSGFGGLMIMKSIVDALPEYDYIYLGDTARTPYGTRSQEVVFAFTQQAIDFLFAQGCKLIIIACNTASAEALPRLQQHYARHDNYHQRKILGVIIPTVEETLAHAHASQPIAIMATESTIASQAFNKEIYKHRPQQELITLPAPLLVPLVENGEVNSDITRLVLTKYLAPLQNKNVSHLILGCTHYSILTSCIQKLIAPDITIVTEGPIVAKKLATYLTNHTTLRASLAQNGTRHFCTTDTTHRFKKLGTRFYGAEIHPEKVTLS